MRPIEASPFWSVSRGQDGRSLWPAETSPAATRQNEQFSGQTYVLPRCATLISADVGIGRHSTLSAFVIDLPAGAN
jgi:hypothetical protein